MLTGDNIRENSTLTQPQEQPEEPAGSIDVHNSPCCPKFLMTFRYIACMVLTVRLALNLTETYTSLFPVFEYFTHMGFMITFFHFVLVIQDFWFNECQNSLSPKYSFKKIALCLEGPIIALYWTIVYSPDGTETVFSIIKDIGNHGFPFFCLLIDYTFNLYQFPTKHLLYLMIVTVTYLFINLGYTLATEPIYSVIDWTSTTSYVWVAVTIAVIGIIHCICQVIWYKCKRSVVVEQAKQPKAKEVALH